jgi:hypothetical protein
VSSARDICVETLTTAGSWEGDASSVWVIILLEERELG